MKKENLKILILVGIPASGKSTWSADYVRRNSDWVRVNRDDFRKMLKNAQMCEPKVEDMITDLMKATITKCLMRKLNVIVDNTNLKQKYIKDFIETFKYYADIDYRVFDISVDKAIERDNNREAKVGEGVIKKMHEDYKVLIDSFNFQPVKKTDRPHLVPDFKSELPEKYKYIFWVDADVIFTNLNWVVDGVEALQTSNIIQPFELCVHLEKDEYKPSFDLGGIRFNSRPNQTNNKVWRSFCSNYATTSLWEDKDYNTHGHVGFAWGAKREVLDAVPLYDRALIGGAGHIIAHAAAGQIGHNCITKSFTENIDEVNEWSKKFYDVVKGQIGYVKGDLFHIWHGDINKRQYLKRIQDFTPTTKTITKKDSNGLYITKNGDDQYIRDYFRHREVSNHDDGFYNSMMLGYMTDSSLMGTVLGGNPVGAMIGDMMNNSDNQSGQQQQNDVDNTIHHLMEQSNNIQLDPVEMQPMKVDTLDGTPFDTNQINIQDSINNDTSNVSDPNTFS